MTTADMATAAQSLLALYGALDQAVISTGNPEIEATVERYLPGSTGSNAGWYEELLGFLGQSSEDAHGEPQLPVMPDLGEALAALRDHARPVTLTQPLPSPVTSPPPSATAEPLTPVLLSRMAYAIGALSHLPGCYPPDQWDAQFAQTLTMAGAGRGEELLYLLRHEFGGRDDWPQVMYSATMSGSIDADVGAVPPCNAKAKWVRGRLCVVLTTEFASATVSLNELKNVIDPRNWARCLPLFCSMDPKPTRPDGWRRVLEHFGLTCPIAGTPQLVTALKYWTGPQAGEQVPEPTAWVDYTLDDQPAPGAHGDGRMVVDEGFIRMTSTVNDPTLHGVRVRTRKVVGFRDLGWFPTALFACAMGYGDQGVDMLLGGVAKRAKEGPVGWTDWEPSKPAVGNAAKPETTAGPDPTRRAVTLAVEMLNECVEDISAKSAALAATWASGMMPVEESMTFAADLAARLATDPWRYLQRMYPPTQGDDS